MLDKYVTVRKVVDRTGSASCQKADFGIIGAEFSGTMSRHIKSVMTLNTRYKISRYTKCDSQLVAGKFMESKICRIFHKLHSCDRRSPQFLRSHTAFLHKKVK
jgi:hypothetical protein